MIYIGIDVAKEKHDCFAISSDGEVLFEKLTIKNTLDGFSLLINSIFNFEKNLNKIKVGLEATGHYSNNIVNFLLNKGFSLYLINPLQTNLFRKGQSLRKTKTDKLDARIIATMLISGNLQPYSKKLYHISELKSLVRHRFRLVKERSKCKVSFSRLLTILFPELENVVWSTSQKSALYLLFELPSANDIANCNLKHLTSILQKYSNGKYTKDKAIEFLASSYVSAAFILAEIGDINNFDSPAKVQAFAGLDPSTYQSGKYTATHARMVKRGSKYLRWALLNASRLVAMRDKTFHDYKEKKLSEGKHYFVALSHVTKKLIRVIFYLLKTGKTYQSQHLSNIA